MSFLPVVQRELLVTARKPQTFWGRTASAGILLGFFLALLVFRRANPMFFGSLVIRWLATAVFLECMLAGLRFTCDCLSEEKREGTLGLLFLTNLSGLDVVLGKMIARSLGAIYNLVAVMPVLALPIMIGGVTGGEVGALCVVLLISTLFSLAAGAMVSSRGFRERAVLVQTLVFLLAITIGPRVIAEMGIIRVFEPLDGIRFLSPLNAFIEAGRGWVGPVKTGSVVLLITSALFVIYAAWRIRGAAVEGDVSNPVQPKLAAEARKRPGKWVLMHNPIFWLASRSSPSELRVLLLCGVVVLFGGFCRFILEAQWRLGIPFLLFGTYGFHALYKFLITADACRQLNEDRRSGALELLLATPLPPNLITRGVIGATWKTWRRLAGSLVILNVAWMTEHDFLRQLGVILPCSLVLLAMDGYVLAWWGAAEALKGDRYTRTVFRSFFLVIVPPLLVIVLLVAAAMGSAVTKETVQIIFVVWTIGSLIFDLVLLAKARSRLKHFRLLAAGDALPDTTNTFDNAQTSPWRVVVAQ